MNRKSWPFDWLLSVSLRLVCCGIVSKIIVKTFVFLCQQVIRRDIARTYPEHEFFKKKDGVGQEALFNVMKAYSIHDREVGYCQGSAFIVGLLLMQVCSQASGQRYLGSFVL